MDNDLQKIVGGAARAARVLARSGARAKNHALAYLRKELEAAELTIMDANRADVEAARAAGRPEALIDRLKLDAKRFAELGAAIEQVMHLPDPTGSLDSMSNLENGLTVGRLRIPLGLILFVCEARPGALIEAAALTIKSGNALIVKGGREMARTAAALGRTLGEALSRAGLPPEALSVIPELSQDELKTLLSMDEAIDLVIPRGGEGLIRFVCEHSRIPVLKHYKGVCHLYVDEWADLKMALSLAMNSKTQRPSTCNSLECLLAHKKIAGKFLPILDAELHNAGVAIKAEPKAKALMPHAEAAEPDDFGREFLGLILAVKVVDSMDEAMNHIADYGSKHTEAIVTEHATRGKRFLREVDASCIMQNAATRLNDGGSLGLGAEIGISTTKIHAYGPMGLKELTTTKFVVLGEGQIRT